MASPRSWTAVDVAWELDSALDAPKMPDGSSPNRVPVPVFAKVDGYAKTGFYNVYSVLRMFVDVSHEWCVGKPPPPAMRARYTGT
jgi:hypothetical protein